MAGRTRRATAALSLAALVALLAGPAPRVGAASVQVVLADALPGVTFTRPVFAVQPPDGTPRLFVVEQGGRIWIVDHPAPAPPAVASKRLFLDLSAKVSRAGNEEGLLGLAFHPGYAANRRLFVHYSAKWSDPADRRHEIAELLADPSDPDRADPASERSVLSTFQPNENHWGAWLGFGPDGYLYATFGDGGSQGDPQNRAQDLGQFFGKILRLDVDAAGAAHGIPPDNPFLAREGALPEIFAYGFRNPWRASFDRATGALWVGDVGQGSWEEVDRVVAGGNYGWRLREGSHNYKPASPTPGDTPIDPVSEYTHAEGRAVIGGHVYRGAGIPGLVGRYVFADFETGRLWALEDPYGAATRDLLLDTSDNLASFAEDRDGELYLLSFSGKVLSLRDATAAPPPPPGGLPPTLSALGLFGDLRRAEPAAGALPYRVIAALWSDGAAKDRFLLPTPGSTVGWRATDAFDLPVGGFAVKTFRRKGRRIETRVIRRTADGFDAAAYRWRADLSDADRVDDRATFPADRGIWTVPAPDDCRSCHTESAGFLLGVSARQVPPGTIRAWSRAGSLLGAPPPREVARNRGLHGKGRLDDRARSYLDANCAFCHRPDDPTNAGLDLRATTPLEGTGILDAVPQYGEFGIPDPRILAPGDPDRSTLLARMLTTGEGRMPQLATVVPDRAAIRLLRRWIRRMGR